MKSLWIALVLLALILGGTAINHLYINNVANELNQLLDALPDVGSDGCIEGTRHLLSYWNGCTDYVGLSVNFPIVDRIAEQAVTLAACAECGDLYGFRTALALLRDAVSDMRRLEQFSIGNLL